MKFVNSYCEPLTILAETNGGVLTVSLRLGAEEQNTVQDSTGQGAEQTSPQEPENQDEPVENEVVGPARDLLKNESV